MPKILPLVFLFTLTATQEQAQSQQQTPPPTQSQPMSMILLDELQILSPLSRMAGKKMIGWSVHGSWKTDNDELNLANFDDSSFLLNNFLPISSNRVDYHIEFQLKYNTKLRKEDGIFPSEDVVVFGFSPYMHDARDFDETQTMATLHGILLFVYKVNGEGIVRLETLPEPKDINLADIFKDDLKNIYPGRYCKANFINTVKKLRVETDFENNTFKVFVDNDLCIGSHMDKNVFTEQKVGLVITGFSSLKMPMQMLVREITPYKYSLSEIQNHQNYHYNINNFLTHLDKFDSKHFENSSLSNILYIQKKHLETYQDIEKLLNLMVQRSQKFEEAIQEDQRKNKAGNQMLTD